MTKDISTFCKLYYSSTFCPVTYFDDKNTRICSFPNHSVFAQIVAPFLPHLHNTSNNPGYYISSSFCYFGIIKLQEDSGYLILGPISSTRPNSSTINDVTHDFALPLSQTDHIMQFFLETTQLSFNQFLNSLTYLHYCLNGEELNYATHFSQTSTSLQTEISILHSNKVYDAKEEQQFHNSYLFEQNYLSLVKEGMPEQLKKFLLSTPSIVKEGNMADNALRQAKNTLITGTTLTTRSAITGGLSIETAYQLSDVYIQEAEKMQSLEALQTLQFTMIMDFTERVSQNKILSDMSSEIFRCVQFVSRHTNELIRVDDVAAYIGRSRSYTSRKFKEELGFDLSSFIMRCKLEDAKSLLSFSDKTLSEISSYLCFSSQAYFQNVFKKKYGMTPMQFRNRRK